MRLLNGNNKYSLIEHKMTETSPTFIWLIYENINTRYVLIKKSIYLYLYIFLKLNPLITHLTQWFHKSKPSDDNDELASVASSFLGHIIRQGASNLRDGEIHSELSAF